MNRVGGKNSAFLTLYRNSGIMQPNPKLQNTSPNWNSLLQFLEDFPPSGTRAASSSDTGTTYNTN